MGPAARLCHTVPAGGRYRTLRVDLAGTVVEIGTSDSTWSRRIERRFGAFRTEAHPDLTVVHDPRRDGPPVTGRPPALRLGRSATHEHLDALLTTVLPERLAPALLVHGALLTDGSNTYLCCGLSGAGKSTLAALLPERALCDELAVVRPMGDRFEGIALPYWTSRPGSGPLAAIFVLEHAPGHRLRPLPPTGALRELRRHVCWPTEDPAGLARALETLSELVRSVPVHRLGFRRDPDVWDIITGAVS